jgi:hypothetical protein
LQPVSASLRSDKTPTAGAALQNTGAGPGTFASLANLKGVVMDLLTVILVLVLVGILMWAVNTYIPMDANIKKLLNVVVIILVVLWLLRALGVFAILSQARI